MRFFPSGWFRLHLQVFLLMSLVVPVQAVILVAGDNSANQTPPDAARTDIFNAVAKICNGSGGGAFGSAVCIRGKYMLTARHVNLVDGTHVTFDGGVTLYEIDGSFSPTQIGTADLDLFKLVEDPGLNEVKLFSAAQGDIPYEEGDPAETIYTTATIIGAGLGRNPADNFDDNAWNWGGTSTMAKRWGTNRIEDSFSVTGAYTYQAIDTTLEASSGNDEAAVTRYDSGCGLFVEHDGEWKLAGIATLVSRITGTDASVFDDTTNDLNRYVRITPLAATIESLIPDPSTYTGWKTDHSLYGGDADDDADTDGDGIPQLMEFALGGDPNSNDRSILPTMKMTEDGDTFLEMTVTRPIGLTGVVYVPQTNTGLSLWPTDDAGVDDSPDISDNLDGTEDVTYRRTQAISGSVHAFMRLRVEASGP